MDEGIKKTVFFIGIILQIAFCNGLMSHLTNQTKGSQVIRIYPQTEDDMRNHKIFSNSDTTDFWTPLLKEGRHFDVFCLDWMVMVMTQMMQSKNIKTKTLIEDVDAVVQKSREEAAEALKLANERTHLMEWTAFYPFEKIWSWMNANVRNHNPRYGAASAGTTGEGRHIVIAKVAEMVEDFYAIVDKPGILVDGGYHGREWTSPAAVMYAMNKLLSEDELSVNMTNDFHFYFMPVVNPDGYVHSWNDTRLWASTRSLQPDPQTPSGNSVGVNPKLNFNYKWEDIGLGSPSSGQYRGPEPFSEVESRAVRDWASKLDLVAYVNVNSNGGLWATAWDKTELKAEKIKKTLSKSVIEAMSKVRGKKYKIIHQNDNLLNGSPLGWMKNVMDVDYSFSLYLHDENNRGFLDNPDVIESCGEELFSALHQIYLHLKEESSNDEDQTAGKDEL